MKKKEWSLLLVVSIFLFLVGMFIYSFRSNNVDAIVYINGDPVLELDLDFDDQYRVVGNIGNVNIEVKDQKVRFHNVDCPNHDCEKVGWVEKGSLIPIICLPNGVTLTQE